MVSCLIFSAVCSASHGDNMAQLKEQDVRAIVVTVLMPAAGQPLIDGGRREMWVEIARLESDFVTDAIGDAGEVGLWQIHPVHLPALQAKGIASTMDQLKNPFTNALAAAYVHGEQGFGAWTTAEQASREVVNHGNVDLTSSQDEYEQWIEEQMGNYDFGPIDLITNPIDTLTNLPGVASWMDGLKKFLDIITSADFWKRVGLGALGLFVIIVAIVLYNKSTVASIVTKGKM